ATNAHFPKSTTGTPLSCCKVTTACRHFDQHRVKVRRNLRPGINSAAVKPDTRATSCSISCDFTGIWSKVVGWILGSNTALNSGITTGKFILVYILTFESVACANTYLPGHQVPISDFFRDRMLCLDSKVQFEEHVFAGAFPLSVDQKLYSPCFTVVHCFSDLLCIGID